MIISGDSPRGGASPCGYRARRAGNYGGGGHGACDESVTSRSAGDTDRRPGPGRSRAVARVIVSVVIVSLMIVMIVIIRQRGYGGGRRNLPHRRFRAANVAFVVMIQKILLNGYWTVEDWTTADDSVGDCVWKISIIAKNYRARIYIIMRNFGLALSRQFYEGALTGKVAQEMSGCRRGRSKLDEFCRGSEHHLMNQ